MQLRVVRAFKSTLEDIEEKRSIHSFQSIPSIRSSRSHQGHRPLSAELNSPSDYQCRPFAVEQNGSYTNMALVMQEKGCEQLNHKLASKSRSAENISLSRGSPTCAIAPGVIIAPGGATGRKPPQPPSPRTFSASDIQTKLYETCI